MDRVIAGAGIRPNSTTSVTTRRGVLSYSTTDGYAAWAEHESNSMEIAVIGGTGLIGSRLVTMLTRDGHEVVAASRRSGVDAVTGEGLAEALRGASVVVDVSNSPSFEDAAVMKFFKNSTHNLLACEAAAGVGHHVVLSVVGTERLLRSGHLRAKCAQEKLITHCTARNSTCGRERCCVARQRIRSRRPA